MRKPALIVALFLFAFAGSAPDKASPKPVLKGLWCTGGCCHDYKKHAPLLTGRISELASVEFEVVTGLDTFKDKDYADGYDVVVYDLCYAREKDEKLIGNITRTIHEGKPAVIVHCSLHNFRAWEKDDWREAMGLTSKSHDKRRALKTKKVKDHAITRFWPEDWETAEDELYRNIKFWPKATALMTAYSPESKKDHVVTWINHYGKGRVFATTLGHNMHTVGQDDYHQLLANGVLWVCGKLAESGEPAKGYEGKPAEKSRD